MNRHDEAHAACLNILHDNEHPAPRIADLCTFARHLGSEIDALTADRDRLAADLAAANATLDRLREVLAKWMAFDAFNAYDAIGEIRAILNLEDET